MVFMLLVTSFVLKKWGLFPPWGKTADREETYGDTSPFLAEGPFPSSKWG